MTTCPECETILESASCIGKLTGQRVIYCPKAGECQGFTDVVKEEENWCRECQRLTDCNCGGHGNINHGYHYPHCPETHTTIERSRP